MHRELEIVEDPRGNYEATSIEDVHKALTDKDVPKGVLVRIGNRWFPIKREEVGTRQYKQPYNYRQRRRKLKSKFIKTITDGMQNNLKAEIIAIKLLKIHK
jgi:hypothetical protein